MRVPHGETMKPVPLTIYLVFAAGSKPNSSREKIAYNVGSATDNNELQSPRCISSDLFIIHALWI